MVAKVNSEETRRARPVALALRENEMAFGEVLILIVNSDGMR